jgi:O-antigen/teichoic acid export membrane protein
MSYIKQLAGQTAIYGLSSVVPRLLNYLLVPLYTRVFLPEEYGIVTEMYAYLGFLLVLLTFGMETGYFRFATKSKDNDSIYSTAFYTLLSTSTFFVVIMYLLSSKIVNGLGYPENPEYVVLLAMVIGLDAFCAIPFAKLRLENKAFTFSIIKIVGVTVNILLNLFFLTLCPKIEIFNNSILYNQNLGITYVFISNLVSSLLVTLVLVFKSGSVPKTFNLKQLKSLMLYSIPLLISGLGGTTNESFDRIFIKYLVPEESNPLYQLGIYGSNVKLAVLMVLFIQMYRYAAEPFFFSTADNKDSPKIYSNMIKYFLVFTLLIFLGVGLFTDVFKYLVGSNFREGLGVVPILLLANLFYGIFFNLSIWYKLKNKTWYGIYYTFAGAIVTITLNIILIPNIGYYGAAIARLACYILMCVLCYYGGKKIFPIPYQIKRMALYFTLALLLFFIGFFVNINIYIVSFIFRITLIAIFLYAFIKIEKIDIKSNIKELRIWK